MLLDGIIKNIPDVRVNGSMKHRLPGNLNVSIRYIEGEGMLLMLDMNGIAASSGSACTSGSLDPSHVLLAIGLDHATAHGSLRLTLTQAIRRRKCKKTVEVLTATVARLRAMSPLIPKTTAPIKEERLMYSEKVMDHFMNPRNVGDLEDASCVGKVGNAKCGDIMQIALKIENDVITDVKFKTFGCGAAIATSSMATEMLKGKTIDEAMAADQPRSLQKRWTGFRPRKCTARFWRRKPSKRRWRIISEKQPAPARGFMIFLTAKIIWKNNLPINRQKPASNGMHPKSVWTFGVQYHFEVLAMQAEKERLLQKITKKSALG
jgi:hypothetical protein